MSIIRIPTPLRRFAGGASELELPGATVGALLTALRADHPDLWSMLITEEGALRSFVNIFVGANNVRSSEGLDTPLTGGEVVSIIPAVAGGAA